jgi:hypothetical protein
MFGCLVLLYPSVRFVDPVLVVTPWVHVVTTFVMGVRCPLIVPSVRYRMMASAVEKK